MRSRRTLQAIALMALAAACRGTSGGSLSSRPAGSAPAQVDRDTIAADIVLNPDQHQGVVSLPLGKTLSIPRPLEIAEWQVDFDAGLLALLGPPEKRRTPGPAGWRFRALAPGRSTIVLTSIAAPAAGASPAVAQFSFTIDVVK